MGSKELEQLIDAIAGKLSCDGITKDNFSEDKCRNILSNCVLANKVIVVFDNNIEKVKSLL